MPGTGPTVVNVQLVQAYTESSFANDESGSLVSYTSIPIQEGSAQITLGRETHDPMHAVQYMHDYREEVLGKKSCSIQFTVPLAPTGTASSTGVAAVQSALGLLLKTTMGGEDLGKGSTAGIDWTAKAGSVATATEFEKGSAIGWVNASGILEARPLSNKSGSALTNKLAFSTVPTTGATIYGAATYYLTSDPDGSLNFAVRGLESNDDWLLLGCQLDSMALNLPLEGIPTVQFTFKGVSWLHGDDAAGSFSDISPVTYSNTSPITGHAGRFMARVSGTAAFTSGVTVHVSAVNFEPSLTYAPVPSPSGTEGVYRWRLTRASGPSVSGSFSTFFESTKWHGHRDNKDDLMLLYQIGTEAGKTILLEVATAQITNAQKADASGIDGVTVEWKGRMDALVASDSTDLHRSPFRIHFL